MVADYIKLCNDLREPIEKTGEWVAENNMEEAADALEELQAENEHLKKQLDAAVKDLSKLAHEHCTCYACVNDKFDYQKETCMGCQYNGWDNWQWRGWDGDDNG